MYVEGNSRIDFVENTSFPWRACKVLGIPNIIVEPVCFLVHESCNEGFGGHRVTGSLHMKF